MSKASQLYMPKRHHMTQVEVDAYLGRQVRDDAVQHKWLVPSVRRQPNGTIFYSARDVERVSERIAAHEYPGQEVRA